MYHLYNLQLNFFVKTFNDVYKIKHLFNSRNHTWFNNNWYKGPVVPFIPVVSQGPAWNIISLLDDSFETTSVVKGSIVWLGVQLREPKRDIEHWVSNG